MIECEICKQMDRKHRICFSVGLVVLTAGAMLAALTACYVFARGLIAIFH